MQAVLCLARAGLLASKMEEAKASKASDQPTATVSPLSTYGVSAGGLEVLLVETYEDEEADDLVPVTEQLLYPVGKHLALRELVSGEAALLRRKDGGETVNGHGAARGCGITAMAAAPNQKVIAACERVAMAAPLDSDERASAKGRDGPEADAASARRRGVGARLMLYQAATRAPIRTLDVHCGAAGVAACAFTPDSMFVVTAAEMEPASAPAVAPTATAPLPGSELALWQWDAARIVARISVPGERVTRALCAAALGPSEGPRRRGLESLVVSTSGPQHVQCWSVRNDPKAAGGPDGLAFTRVADVAGELRLVGGKKGPGASETNQCADHTWVRAPPPPPSASSEPAGAAHHLVVACNPALEPAAEDGGGSAVPRRKEKLKPAVHVFASPNNANALALELVETHGVEVPGTGHARVQCVRGYSRGFVVGGSGGLLTVFKCGASAPKSSSQARRGPAANAAASTALYVRAATLAPEPFSTGLPPPVFLHLAVAEKAGRVVAYGSQHPGGRLVQVSLGELEQMAPGDGAKGGGGGAPVLADVLPGGTHHGAIVSMDVCHNRPLLITAGGGSDHTVRLWNLRKCRCEITHLTQGEEVTAVALHPLGFVAAIASRDRVRTYHVLLDALRFIDEALLKNCHGLKYSHGGHAIAAVSGITVLVLSSASLAITHSFAGHISLVRCLAWSDDDTALYTTGTDGNVCSWDLVAGARCDDAALGELSRATTYVGLAVAVPKQRSKESRLIVAGTDGALREVTWRRAHADSHMVQEYDAQGPQALAQPSAPVGLSRNAPSVEGGAGDAGAGASSSDGAGGASGGGSAGEAVAVTTLTFDRYARFLIAGCSNGAIRVYRHPLSGEYVEYLAHGGAATGGGGGGGGASATATAAAGRGGGGTGAAAQSVPACVACAVTAIHVAADNKTIISSAEDGTTIVFKLTTSGASSSLGSLSGSGLEAQLGGFDPNAQRQNVGTVLVAQETVDEAAKELRELRKMCVDMRSEMDYSLHLKDHECQERVRQQRDEVQAEVAAEAARYEALTRSQKDEQLTLRREKDQSDAKFLEVMQRLEGAFEGRHAHELERYDTLRHEITQLENHCEERVSGKQRAHEEALDRLRGGANKTERDLRKQYEQMLEEAKYQDMVYRETLQQQEHEYESEVAKLIASAEKELATERDKTSRLHAQIQRLNTHVVFINKKSRELEIETEARDGEIQTQLEQNEVIETDVKKCSSYLDAQVSKLEKAEKTVSELNAKTNTLENFRSVLDSRVAELTAERVPFTEQLGELDKKMYSIYDTLTEKFAEKKRSDEAMARTERRHKTSAAEAVKLRAMLREREREISQFKRELALLVHLTANDAVEGVADLNRKYGSSLGPQKRSRTRKSPDAGGSAVEHDADADQPRRNARDDAGDRTTADEAEMRDELTDTLRHRDLLRKTSTRLKHAVAKVEKDEQRGVASKQGDHQTLMIEVNTLRRNNIAYKREQAGLTAKIASCSDARVHPGSEMDISSPSSSERFALSTGQMDDFEEILDEHSHVTEADLEVSASDVSVDGMMPFSSPTQRVRAAARAEVDSPSSLNSAAATIASTPLERKVRRSAKENAKAGPASKAKRCPGGFGPTTAVVRGSTLKFTGHLGKEAQLKELAKHQMQDDRMIRLQQIEIDDLKEQLKTLALSDALSPGPAGQVAPIVADVALGHSHAEDDAGSEHLSSRTESTALTADLAAAAAAPIGVVQKSASRKRAPGVAIRAPPPPPSMSIPKGHPAGGKSPGAGDDDDGSHTVITDWAG